jgi:uncharacterized membrane protein
VYGSVLVASGVAYTILQTTLIAANGENSLLAKAVGDDLKGKVSIVLYLAGIAAAFVETRVSAALYVCVALTWFVPDRRIEERVQS